MRNINEAPAEVIDWYNECMAEGYVPSQEDFLDEFGAEYHAWMEGLSYVRETLQEDITDEVNPRSEHEELRERGLNLKRDFL